MKRVSNLNSFSAVIDRLIIEHLKLIKFVECKEKERAESQVKIIDGLKNELSAIFAELKADKYNSLDENRTYESKANQLIDDIFKLCVCNRVIGNMDEKKIKSAEKGLSVRKMRGYILQVRDYLEFRSYIKNKMEKDII